MQVSVLKCSTLREDIYLSPSSLSVFWKAFSSFFFSHKLSYCTLRSAVLGMLCVQAELTGLSFVVHCFFRALGVQNSPESMEKSRGEREGRRNWECHQELHNSDLPQTPDGAAVKPEWFCHTNISWTHFGKPTFLKPVFLTGEQLLVWKTTLTYSKHLSEVVLVYSVLPELFLPLGQHLGFFFP